MGARFGAGSWVRGLAGIALGSVILVLLFRRIDPKLVADELSGASLSRVALAAAFILASYASRAALWRRLLRSSRDYPYGPVFRATLIGYLLNNVLPARLGDVSRGLWLSRTRGGESGAIFGSLALERILDFGVILAMVVGSVWFVPGRNPMILVGIAVIAVAIVAFFLASALLGRAGAGRIRGGMRSILPSRMAPIWDRYGRVAARQVSEATSLRNARQGLAITALTWIITLGGLYCALDALGLSGRVGIAGLAFLLGVASLGFSIPSLPASLGAYQASFVFGAVLAGIPETQALAASLLYQGLGVLVTSSGGLFALLWEGILGRGQTAPRPIDREAWSLTSTK